MDFITLSFLLSAFFTASAQQIQSNVSRGSFLTPTTNSTWLSQSGLFAFGFYKQGNGYAFGIFMAGIPENTVVWTANRDDPPVSGDVALLFATGGRLVLQLAKEQVAVVAASFGSASASMLNSGNFVIYNSNQEIIWESFEHPTDTLLPGQRLLAGQELISSMSETQHSSGIFRLKMQNDGNLVQYLVGTPDTAPFSFYTSRTGGSGDNVTLNFDADAHLYLLDTTGFNIRNLMDGGFPTEDTIYLMRLDADGIFLIYSHHLKQKEDWSIEWLSSNDVPDDKCAPKGLCGFNGYCDLNVQGVGCKCLPGFASVNQGDWGSGCERDFTAESCKNNKNTMEAVPNTVWENNNYSVLISSTQENCREACLQDCNCEAALFKDGVCTKQRFPLRFGRRLQRDSTVALIKVGTSIDRNLPKEDIIIVSVSFVAFALIVLAISGIAIYRYRVWSYKRISNNGDIVFREDFAPKSFTYIELEKVTDGFKEELGRGAFGTVYKGAIRNGDSEKNVAVKRLDKLLAEREREFHTEMKVIGRTHHKNLVRLLGYCHDGPNRLLVYEFMTNGSLADILFTPEKQPSWDERMEIALNIGRGILYLHEECEPQIIHCDIKPQNILMDENRCPKISDFGLAKLLKADQTRTFTDIRGTKGYVAPEWHRKRPVTVKVDVYSFGIMLLEIICCRKSVDQNLPEEEAILEEWAYQCFESGELGRLVNNEKVDKRQLERMVKVGFWCILDEPSLRPSIKKVLLMLEGTIDIPAPPCPTSFLKSCVMDMLAKFQLNRTTNACQSEL
ncbi:G-type lectin S-receptor-like serine/threonine-protein kinase LECRK3 [Corylus avellana]|uniref:G-type lectin S-receptor-like serine/threonine-protein kinase LECRK3 n=1 Tax=Corylus avellana TaxID=13451 RepID=UPI00286D2830|nr:G-type lectin S-receptor-like serine/threonine-protein kinase LECRK3 [Corylus avellana]